MKIFIRNFLQFSICFIILIGAFLWGYCKLYGISLNKDIPAPNLSDSYSYNEKLLFLHKLKDYDPSVLAIGSSMTLNNLNSTVITNRLHTENYLNAGSWGMSVKDSYDLLKLMMSKNVPDTVIMASNIMDFETRDKVVQHDLLPDFLYSDKDDLMATHIKTFNVGYYVQNVKWVKRARVTDDEYTCLKFDKYGGINFYNKDFRITQERWNKGLFDAILPYQYGYLDSIASLCNKNNVRFVFLQTPVRAGLKDKYTDKQMGILNQHITKVEQIVKDNKGLFVSTFDQRWPDSLFVDGTHLNGEGSRLFTDYCLRKL